MAANDAAKLIDAAQVASAWLRQFEAAISAKNIDAIVDLFLPDGFLRDVFVFSWDTRTLQGHAAIKDFLLANFTTQGLKNFTIYEDAFLRTKLDTSTPGFKFVDLTYTFETENAKGRGGIKLVPIDGAERTWKALSVLTSVRDWTGYEEGIAPKRWIEGQSDPEVLIVGAGLCGLQHASRLMESNLSVLVIDKAPRVGDSWRMRYPSLKLHVPRVYCQLLYQQYPANYPTFMTKTQVADSLETYAQAQNIPIWSCSFIEIPPTFNAEKKSWTVVINKGGDRIILHPSHIIMAVSTFSGGIIPTISGQDEFRGIQQHTDGFSGGAIYRDKRVLIVGSANSAADICVDLVKEKAKSVTMLQRNATCIRSSEFISEWICASFKEDVPVGVTDFQVDAGPVKLVFQALRMQTKTALEHDKEMLEGLKKSGFLLTDGPTGAGMLELGLTRGGGYSIDSGCSALISDGTINLKSGLEITRMKEHSVVFSDSSEIEVDAIIYATGYKNVRETYIEILGRHIVDQTSDLWNLDEEGELRGVCRPTGHPRLWYAAGDFAFSRRTSKQMAILIKACQLGYCDL